MSGGGALFPSAGSKDTARLIPRFTVSERIAHWLLATAFAAMLTSGVFMGGIGPLGHHAMLVVHLGFGRRAHLRIGSAQRATPPPRSARADRT